MNKTCTVIKFITELLMLFVLSFGGYIKLKRPCFTTFLNTGKRVKNMMYSEYY